MDLRGDGAALEQALLLCGQLSWFWHVSGQHNTARALLDELLVLAANRPPSRGRAFSYLAAGMVSITTGQWERALIEWSRAHEDAGAIGHRPEVARILCESMWTELAREDTPAAQKAFGLAVRVYEEVGSPRGTGLALLGLAAVEAAEGRSERAVAIAEAAHALAARAGVVCDHPMDPGVAERIEALKVVIPRQTVDGIVAGASGLSPAAILAMVETSKTD